MKLASLNLLQEIAILPTAIKIYNSLKNIGNINYNI